MRNKHHVLDVHDVKSLQQFLLDLWTAAQLGFQLTHPNGWCSICIISRWTTLLTSMHIYMFKPSSGLTFGSLHHFTTGACWRNDCSRQTDYTIYVNDFNLHLTPQISTTFIVVHFRIFGWFDLNSLEDFIPLLGDKALEMDSFFGLETIWLSELSQVGVSHLFSPK